MGSSLHTLRTNVLILALSFLVNVALARSLLPEGKGGLDLFEATKGLMTVFLGFSLSAGVIYSVSRGGIDLRKLQVRLSGMAVMQAAAAVCILIIMQYFGLNRLFLPVVSHFWLILAMGLVILFGTMATYLMAILFGEQRLTESNNINLFNNSAYAMLVLGYVLISVSFGRKVTYSQVIALTVISSIVSVLSFGRKLRTSTRRYPWQAEDSGFKAALVFSIPCHLGNLVQFLNYRFDIFLVNFFRGQRDVGLYVIAVTIAQLVWILSNSVATVLFPKISKEGKNQVTTLLVVRASRIVLWSSLGISIVLAVLAPIALPAIYGKSFRPSVAPLLFLLPGITFFSLVNMLASFLAGIGQPKWNLWIAVAGLGVTVFFDLLLIPRFGIIGAAIASSLSYSTSSFLTLWVFHKLTQSQWLSIGRLTMNDVSEVVGLCRRFVGKPFARLL